MMLNAGDAFRAGDVRAGLLLLLGDLADRYDLAGDDERVELSAQIISASKSNVLRVKAGTEPSRLDELMTSRNRRNVAARPGTPGE